MNIKKLNKKILVSVLSAMFILTYTGGVANTSKSIGHSYAAEQNIQETKSKETTKASDTSKKDDIVISNTVSDVNVNSGEAAKVYFVGNTAKVTLSSYNVDKNNDGYLLVDINRDFVKGASSKFFSSDKKVDDAMRISIGFDNNGQYTSSGMEDTIVRDDFCSYGAKDSGYIRFYVPYHNASGKMTVTFTIPKSVQDKINEEIEKAKKSSDKPEVVKKAVEKNRMEAMFFSETIKSDDLLTKQTGDLVYDGNKPVSGFVNVDTYNNLEDEVVYKGFIFDQNDANRVLRIRPKTNANKIRLYLGAGNGANGFSYSSSNGEFDIKYYDSGSTYRKVNDGKQHNKNEFKKSEYDRISMSLSSGFRSVDIPWKTTDGIIEIRMNNANNFLLNLKVQALTNVNVNGNSSNETVPTTPVVKETIDAVAHRYAGSDRYDTAIELSKKAFTKSDVAVVASGQNFADALSGGGLAAIKNAPLLLVNNSNSTIDSVNKELRRLGVKEVYVLGGKSSISVSTEMKLTNDKDNDSARKVVRLDGKNRYETSYEIYKEVNRSKDSVEKPILVNGQNFADALSAGSLAGYTKRGILLTDGHNMVSGLGLSKDNPDNIIIGGNSSMDTSFKGRRISGANRYETSVNVAKYIHGTKNVIIASGEKYPDGLASISLYGKYKAPLILTTEYSLPSVAKKYISNEKMENAYIVGGVNSVSDKVKYVFK